ncbi:MAG: fibrobacter succinogenes major paralogous domain-containing protein [Bacteroidota bacterium]
MITLLLLLLTACAREDIMLPEMGGEEDERESFFELREETLLITDDTNRDLVQYQEDELAYEMMGARQLDSIEVGSILLSRPTDLADGGYLKKVVSKRMEGSRMVLEVEDATLPEAFERYDWLVGGNVSSAEGRNGPQTQFMVPSNGPITFNVTVPVSSAPNAPTVTFGVSFDYDLQITNRVSYNLSNFFNDTPVVEEARLGVEKFEIKEFTVSKAYGISAMTMDTNVTTINVLDPLDLGSVEFSAIPAFPVDPAAVVWIKPVVSFDLSAIATGMVALGASFTVRSDDIGFRSVLEYTAAGGFELPSPRIPTFSWTADAFIRGSVGITPSLGVSIGLAPYTSSLLKAGVKASVGVELGVSGDARLQLTSEGTVNPGISLAGKIEGVAAVDAFIDGHFFGFATDALDVQRRLFEYKVPIFEIAADNSCQYFFDQVIADVDCDGSGGYNFIASVSSLSNPPVTVNGDYAVYMDGELILPNAELNETYTNLPLPDGFSPGWHTIRLQRVGATSWIPCDSTILIQVPDCSSVGGCVPEDRVLGPSGAFAYCTALMPGDKRWTVENLREVIENEDGSSELPRCYDFNEANCDTYGNLYLFEEATNYGSSNGQSTPNGICPEGYHLPTVQDWLTLFGAPNTEPNEYGVYLIQNVDNRWRDLQSWGGGFLQGVRNGFNAQAGGFYAFTSNEGFSDLGEEGKFWTSTISPSGGAYAVIFDRSNQLSIQPIVEQVGAHCRCVQD